jgi:predicted transcriptional regulator
MPGGEETTGKRTGLTGPDAVLVRLLRQFTVESDRFIEMFGEAHGLHRTDLNALVVIMDAQRRGTSVSAGELARALHLSASATTAVLDRLEAAGHVQRARSGHDRRRIGLLMPEDTTRLGNQLFQPLGEELSRAWVSYTPEQRELIAAFLETSIQATVRVRARLLDE